MKQRAVRPAVRAVRLSRSKPDDATDVHQGHRGVTSRETRHTVVRTGGQLMHPAVIWLPLPSHVGLLFTWLMEKAITRAPRWEFCTLWM